MIKKCLKKVIPANGRVKMRRAMAYLQALFYHVFYGREIKCTATTLRCEYNKYSKNYGYAVLGRNMPICCASHLVELLFWVDKVLRKNSLFYMIGDGTLLGAVRHQGGIIPWDTDIDCYINEKDREQIYQILLEQAKISKAPYKVVLERNTHYGEIIKIFFSEVNTLHVDLFSYTENGDWINFVEYQVEKDDVFPLRELDFYGRKVYAPKTLATLDIYYGADWNKYYYTQWGLFTKKCVLTNEKRRPATIDRTLIKEY